MNNVGRHISQNGLEHQGLEGVKTAHWNYNRAQLFQEAVQRQEGKVSAGGAIVTLTGLSTGRSPNDRFVVEEATTKDEINWGKVNRPTTQEKFDGVHKKMLAHMQGREVFVQDCFCGADEEFRLPVRIVNENAWHNMFARNMFIQPDASELTNFQPQFTVIQAPSLEGDPETDGLNSGNFILVDIAQRLILVGGTGYAGEVKKSIFSIMNFLLPLRGVLPMHCSANVGTDGDSAIFFGLSGTGKTTLSADSARSLIGDDEHGWGPNGVFNFEGGCYAKTVNLTHEAEPEIYDLCHTFGSVIENVLMDEDTRTFDFFDNSITENGRVSYDLSMVTNAHPGGKAGHPDNIMMLTCDAFGVLPPISQLSPAQAMYHFLSGYTAKVAGTEKGLKEPQATFSACFGAPFMPRHPSVYAKLLGDKMASHNSKCWLVNTGWSGGAYGTGSRMKIAYTRAMINAALDGTLAVGGFTPDPNFGVLVPNECPNVPTEVLNPRNTWADGNAYDAQAKHLRELFEENFKQFEEGVEAKVNDIAIRAA